MLKGQQRIGVEFKRADAPKVTPSMRIAAEDLKLAALYVVHPGLHRYRLAEGIEAVPLWALLPSVSLPAFLSLPAIGSGIGRQMPPT